MLHDLESIAAYVMQEKGLIVDFRLQPATGKKLS